MPSRIRSGYRRRLLDWLADGGGTVSDAAQSVGLHLPHASSELKQLREDGWVASDREEGSKGAVQRLTEVGWKRLQDDDIARLQAIDRSEMPAEAIGCVLARDGTHLLLAYAQSPSSALISLPNRPFTQPEEVGDTSTGNQGGDMKWVWAVRRDAAEHWVDISTMKSLSGAPEKIDPSRIEGWDEPLQAWVILRVQLLERGRKLALSGGSWIQANPEGKWPNLPASSIGGDWELGTAAPAPTPVRPSAAIAAVIEERITQGLLMRIAGEGSWVLGDLDMLGRPQSPWPLEALTGWIFLAHTRLDSEEIERRRSWLRTELVGRSSDQRRSSRQQATWNRFASAWPSGLWRSKDPGGEAAWDLRGLDDGARIALIEWALDSTPSKVVIQWPSGIELARPLCERLLSHPNLRLLIMNREPPSASPLILRTAPEGLPSSRLQLPSGISLPVQLSSGSPPPLRLPDIALPEVPEDIAEVAESLTALGVILPESLPSRPPADLDDAIRISCLLYPEGDGDWANICEGQTPLAAWIASPRDERWNRWLRISSRLDEVWLPLLSPNDIPSLELVEIASTIEDDEWAQIAGEVLSRRLIEHPDLLLDLHPLTMGKVNPWLASVGLVAAPRLEDDYARVITAWAWPAWLESPTHGFSEVLPALVILEQRGLVTADWKSELGDGKLPDDGPIGVWSELMDLKSASIQDGEFAMRVVETIPMSWWSPWASEILQLLLREKKWLRYLLREDIPWAAMVLRSSDESHSIPGVERQFQQCPDDLLVTLEVHRDRFEKNPTAGSEHLLDLIDALEAVSNGRPPPLGRRHRNAGWLAQPLALWPHFEIDEWIDGDVRIGARLFARISGYHEGLKTAQQSRLD